MSAPQNTELPKCPLSAKQLRADAKAIKQAIKRRDQETLQAYLDKAARCCDYTSRMEDLLRSQPKKNQDMGRSPYRSPFAERTFSGWPFRL